MILEADKKKIGRRVKIGDTSIIKGNHIVIEDEVTIGEDVVITADKIFIGYGTNIEDRCKITLGDQKSEFIIGDNCLIGSDSKISVPTFKIGDYVTINNHALVNGYKSCTIGHNSWFGQNCVLNATETLTIGNNVGGGIYSSMWTHGFYGELLEGCNLYKVAPITIEDDVWILGSYNIIFPGTRLGTKSIIMTGSAVTKDVKPYSCVSGNPARDITDKIKPYSEISLEEKVTMLKGFMEEFIEQKYPEAEKLKDGWKLPYGEILFLSEATDSLPDEEKIVFTQNNLVKKKYEKIVLFDIKNKKYTKRRLPLEVEIMRFLVTYRARFLPA